VDVCAAEISTKWRAALAAAIRRATSIKQISQRARPRSTTCGSRVLGGSDERVFFCARLISSIRQARGQASNCFCRLSRGVVRSHGAGKRCVERERRMLADRRFHWLDDSYLRTSMVPDSARQARFRAERLQLARSWPPRRHGCFWCDMLIIDMFHPTGADVQCRPRLRSAVDSCIRRWSAFGHGAGWSSHLDWMDLPCILSDARIWVDGRGRWRCGVTRGWIGRTIS